MMRLFQFLLIVPASLTLAGCELIDSVFEAGVWVGIIVVGVLALVGYLIARLFR